MAETDTGMDTPQARLLLRIQLIVGATQDLGKAALTDAEVMKIAHRMEEPGFIILLQACIAGAGPEYRGIGGTWKFSRSRTPMEMAELSDDRPVGHALMKVLIGAEKAYPSVPTARDWMGTFFYVLFKDPLNAAEWTTENPHPKWLKAMK
jgi:hypothetical protein